MKSNLRILMVCSDFPYPANHGGRVDVFTRIKAYYKAGYLVDVLATIKNKDDNVDIDGLKKYVDDVFLVKRNKYRSLISLFPFQVSGRAKLREVQLDKRKQYDVVFMDGEYVIPVIYNKILGSSFKILRVNNNESLYFFNLFKSAKNIINKIYYLSESLRFKIFKKNFYNKVDALFFVSYDEYLSIKNKKSFKSISDKIYFFPTIANVKKEVKFNETKIVLFVGALFMPNNIEGINWYLDNVHENLIKSYYDYFLIIAGNSRGVNTSFLHDRAKIKFYDSPSDSELNSLYEKSDVFINPMLSGAGVKLKTINAIENGLPVVSTTIGSEGIGLNNYENFILADSAEEFYKSIALLFDDDSIKKRLVYNSQKYLISEFSEKNACRVLENCMLQFKSVIK